MGPWGPGGGGGLEGASVAPRAEADVSLHGVLHKPFGQGRGGTRQVTIQQWSTPLQRPHCYSHPRRALRAEGRAALVLSKHRDNNRWQQL